MDGDRIIPILQSIADSLETIAHPMWKNSDEIHLQDARRRLESFGEEIREARVKRGLTLERLAAIVDVDQPQLSRIERGQTMPSFSLEQALERWLMPPGQ